MKTNCNKGEPKPGERREDVKETGTIKHAQFGQEYDTGGDHLVKAKCLIWGGLYRGKGK